MAHCYLLTVAANSSVDRQTNSASLFNLVERVRVPAEAMGQTQVVPVEVHSYWQLTPHEVEQSMDLRWVLVAPTQLETSSPVFKHRPEGARFRMRVTGLPLPPVMGEYSLRVDYRFDEDTPWQRASAVWPLTFFEAERRPHVTH